MRCRLQSLLFICIAFLFCAAQARADHAAWERYTAQVHELRQRGAFAEAEKAAISGDVIKPVLHHATMRTSHLDEMVAWYGRVIGARVTFRNEHAAWTSNDGANHRVAFLAVPGLSDDPQKVGHNGLHHLAFEYGSFDDLMSSYKRLADEGITPSFCLDHGMTVSLYYRDPEANYVELQCDCFADWKHSREWMENSADFAANRDWVKKELKREMYITAFSQDDSQRVAIEQDEEVLRAIDAMPKAKALVDNAKKLLVQRVGVPQVAAK